MDSYTEDGVETMKRLFEQNSNFKPAYWSGREDSGRNQQKTAYSKSYRWLNYLLIIPEEAKLRNKGCAQLR